VNRKALEVARIDKRTRDPEGGKIVRDTAGNPTGILIDNAVDLVDEVIPQPSEAERTEAVQKAVQECLRVGLTGVHDMGVDLPLITIYKRLIAQKDFPFRVYAALSYSIARETNAERSDAGQAWSEYLTRGLRLTAMMAG
jgi:predicted amidohydrolase YtcJ